MMGKTATARKGWSVRFVLAMFVAGIAVAAALAAGSGTLATPDEQLVGGLPLSTTHKMPIYLSQTGDATPRWVRAHHERGKYFTNCNNAARSADLAPGTTFAPTCTNTAPVGAWRWSGSRWVARSYVPGEWVWLHPWTKDWSWTWTRRQGWLALHDSRIVVGYEDLAIAT